MAVTSLETDFFQRLRTCTQPVLLLDYDGTMAPFTVERSNASPYPGVVEALQGVLEGTNTRVASPVIILAVAPMKYTLSKSTRAALRSRT